MQTVSADGGSRTHSDTYHRLLEKAERLFADRGISAVSVRDITRAADANLGAVNYHFGTKEKLIEAVIKRRIEALNVERLRALDAAERAGNDSPSLETVLDAIIRPVVEQAMDRKRGGPAFAKLMARCLVDPHPVVEAIIQKQFESVVRRFDDAILRAVPTLEAGDLIWRMQLLMGALHQSLLLIDRKLPGRRALNLDLDSYVSRFIAFATAALKAPLPALPPS